MIVIDFYRTASNGCPVKEFLDGLTDKQAKKITWIMQLIEELKYVPGAYFKKLVNTENIWEIRGQVGSDTLRILGFFIKENIFIATNGFRKKTQKTPNK